jgi:hypothetical protein
MNIGTFVPSLLVNQTLSYVRYEEREMKENHACSAVKSFGSRPLSLVDLRTDHPSVVDISGVPEKLYKYVIPGDRKPVVVAKNQVSSCFAETEMVPTKSSASLLTRRPFLV